MPDDSFASRFVGLNGGEVANGSPRDSLSGSTNSNNAGLNAGNPAYGLYNTGLKVEL